MLQTLLDVTNPGMVGQVDQRLKQKNDIDEHATEGSLVPVKMCCRKIFGQAEAKTGHPADLLTNRTIYVNSNGGRVALAPSHKPVITTELLD